VCGGGGGGRTWMQSSSKHGQKGKRDWGGGVCVCVRGWGVEVSYLDAVGQHGNWPQSVPPSFPRLKVIKHWSFTLFSSPTSCLVVKPIIFHKH
jgi:hypothetical protein